MGAERASGRTVLADGARRRWWRGAGGQVPAESERLLRHGLGHTRDWRSSGRAAGPGVDQVEAERRLWALVDAGLVEVHERFTRRGDWEPYEWRLTPEGEAQATPADDVADAIAAYLGAPDGSDPTLAAIRAWLTAAPRRGVAARLVLAVGAELRAGRPLRGRLLSVQVTGRTKALRIADFRDVLEEALGLPVDDLLRPLGDAVLLAGPLWLVVRDEGGEREVDPGWCTPWLALPPETVARVGAIRTAATRVVTVENLLPFEELARAGLPEGTLALYVGGFPGRNEREVLRLLVAAGVGEVLHWGDLDVGGLRILRHVAAVAGVPVRPFRMEPELLERLPTQPLSEPERAALRAWVADPTAPARELAAAMLARDAKAEQEGWWLDLDAGPPDSVSADGSPPSEVAGAATSLRVGDAHSARTVRRRAAGR